MWFQSLVNTVEFRLRNRLKLSRGRYDEPIESKVDLFRESPANGLEWSALEQQYVERYSLQAFRERSSRLHYLEVLAMLKQLETLLPVDVMQSIVSQCDGVCRWLDVGTKNGIYLAALVYYSAAYGLEVSVDGLEIDPYRLYWDGHTRKDYADAFLKDRPNVHYRIGDVTDCSVTEALGQYHVVSSFLPFVFESPHLAWGLPLTSFRPEVYCAAVQRLVLPNGFLLVTNQGEEESRQQARLLAHSWKQSNQSDFAGFETVFHGELSMAFIPYRHRRYGWCLQKQVRFVDNDPSGQDGSVLNSQYRVCPA